MNSGVSSYMWMKPCSSRRMSLGMWREVRVSPWRKIGISGSCSGSPRRRLAQVQHGGVELGAGGEFLVVDREDEGRGAALLLGERGEVAVAGDPQHVEAFLLDGVGQGADAEARGVLGTEVLVDDDDGKVEAHFLPTPWPPPRGRGVTVVRPQKRGLHVLTGPALGRPGGGASLRLPPVQHQIFGKVTPTCPWYLPPRSLYEVSQTSSDSKNSTWAQPSPA
jgi:hypothetical protein